MTETVSAFFLGFSIGIPFTVAVWIGIDYLTNDDDNTTGTV